MGRIPSALLSSKPVERGASGQHPSAGLLPPLPGAASAGWIGLWVALPLLEGAKIKSSLLPSPASRQVGLPTGFLDPHMARGERSQKILSILHCALPPPNRTG